MTGRLSLALIVAVVGAILAAIFVAAPIIIRVLLAVGALLVVGLGILGYELLRYPIS
jgi:hypothetical protein